MILYSELWVIEILGNNKGPLFWHMNPKILKFIWNSWHRFTFLFSVIPEYKSGSSLTIHTASFIYQAPADVQTGYIVRKQEGRHASAAEPPFFLQHQFHICTDLSLES